MTFSKVLNSWTLLLLNVIAVFVVETTRSVFANTGLIHLLAIIFVVLALIRATSHSHVHDQYLEPVIHRGIFAMLILAISHLVEFASFMIFSLPREAISVNVVNFYLASSLIVITGVEVFVGKLDRLSQKLYKIIEIIASLFFLLIVSTLFNPKNINLHSSSWMTYAYTTSIFIIEIFCLWRLQILKKRVPLMTKFINYFIAAFILIGLSALLYTLEDIVVKAGLPFLQLIYLSHFLFYGALSLIFLAYDHLLHLGGIYDDLEKMKLN